MSSLHRRRHLTLALLVAMQALPASSGLAQTLYWDINGSAPGAGDTPDASGVWDATLAHWSLDPDGLGETGAWSPGATAEFSAGDTSADHTITLADAAPLSAAALNFRVGSATVELTGGSLTDVAEIFVAKRSSAILHTLLADSDTPVALAKTGGGTLTLAGANTFSGGLDVQAGELVLAAGGLLGTGDISVSKNATLTSQGELTLVQDLRVGGAGGAFVAEQSVTTSGAEELVVRFANQASGSFLGDFSSDATPGQFVLFRVRDAGTVVNVAGDIRLGGGAVEVLDGGFLAVAGKLEVNDAPGVPDPFSFGEVLVSGEAATLFVGADLRMGDGELTDSHLILDTGGYAVVNGGLALGAGETTQSSLSADGMNTALTITANADLASGDDAEALVEISDGAIVGISGALSAASGTESVGNIEVSGTDAFLSVGTDLIAALGHTSEATLYTLLGGTTTIGETLDAASGDAASADIWIADVSSSLDVGGDITLGAGESSEVFLTVESGAALTAGAALHVFGGDLSTGVVEVLGEGSSLTTVGDIRLSHGEESSGELTAGGGASILVGGDLLASDGPASVSLVRVRGTGTALDVGGNLELARGDFSLGELVVRNGASLSVGHNLYASDGFGSASSMTVRGPETTVTVTDNLDLGYGDESLSELTLREGARLDVGGEFRAGYGESSVSSVSVASGGVLTATDLNIGGGDDGTSGLTITDGGIVVAGNSLTVGEGAGAYAGNPLGIDPEAIDPNELEAILSEQLLQFEEPQFFVRVAGADAGLFASGDLTFSTGVGSLSMLEIAPEATVHGGGDLVAAAGLRSAAAIVVGPDSGLSIGGDVHLADGQNSLAILGAALGGQVDIDGHFRAASGLGSAAFVALGDAETHLGIVGSLRLGEGAFSLSGLTVGAGAEVFVEGPVFVGAGASSIAAMGASGPGANISILSDMIVAGGFRSVGTIGVEQGGSILTLGKVHLGAGDASEGNALVMHSDSRWDILGSLHLGEGVNSDSTIHVLDGGTLSVLDHLELAAGASSTTTVEIGDFGVLQVGGADAIRSGPGDYSFTLSDGTLRTVGAETTSAIDITLAATDAAFGSAIETADEFNTTTLSGVIDGDGALVKLGDGRLVLTAANTYTGGTEIFEGSVRVAAGAEGSALGANHVFVHSDTLLFGQGVIDGPVNVFAGGTLLPGELPGDADFGTLTIGNESYIQGVLEFFLAGTERGVTYATLILSGEGTLELDGATLLVSLHDLFAPELGDAFDLIDFDFIDGSFATIDLPELAPGLAWDTSALHTDGVISVVLASAIPEPAGFATLAALGALAHVTLRRRRRA